MKILFFIILLLSLICINQKSIINQHSAVEFVLGWTAQTSIMSFHAERMLLQSCRLAEYGPPYSKYIKPIAPGAEE